jgi:DNA-binding transcriptional LysR family regulator
MSVNLKLLSTFLAVAQSGSFRKAADQTNRSLPAVSMQIKQLEEQLGLPLFQRTTRKVVLTREGEKLMITARRALAEIESGLTQIKQAVNVQHGHLAFACAPMIASTRLPDILATFTKKHPGISLNVRELVSSDLLEAVRRREVDFGIGPIVERRGEFDFHPIFVDEYCALLPAGYRHGNRTSISQNELSRMPILKLSSTATAFRDYADDYPMIASQLVSKTNYNYDLAQMNTLIAMAEAGLGVALLPRLTVPKHTTLKVVRITRPAMSRTIAITTLKGDVLSPVAQRLVDLCEEMLAP